jgi:hypothetical protein
MKLKIILLPFVFLLIFSCEKEDPPHYPIYQKTLDWFYYKEGSYWVYLNETTQGLDSAFVSESNFQITKYVIDKKLKYTSDLIYNTISSNMNKNLFSYAYINSYNLEKIYNKIELTLIDIELKFKVNEEIFESSIEKSFLDTYKVNNINFSEVMYIKIPNELYNETNLRELFIAKNNWIIKKVISVNDTLIAYSLVRKHIVQ